MKTLCLGLLCLYAIPLFVAVEGCMTDRGRTCNAVDILLSRGPMIAIGLILVCYIIAVYLDWRKP